MTPARVRLAVLPVAAVAIVLAGCAASPDAGTEPTSVPDGSATTSQEPSPSEPADASWQAITAPDAASFEIPADWTVEDASIENDVGTVVGLDVLDATGSLVLTYTHDQGGAGGVGGECATTPESQQLGQWEAPAALAPMSTGADVVIAAYAVEQTDGVVLTMGYADTSMLEGQMCLTYNWFLAPDGMQASFASSMTSGTDLEAGVGATTADPRWRFETFDDAQAFVDSSEGQGIVQVLQSLQMPSA